MESKTLGISIPVADHLDEAGGLQLQENVRDDVGSAQHALQAASPQDAMQLRQEEEHVVHKPGNQKKNEIPENLQRTTTNVPKRTDP